MFKSAIIIVYLSTAFLAGGDEPNDLNTIFAGVGPPVRVSKILCKPVSIHKACERTQVYTTTIAAAATTTIAAGSSKCPKASNSSHTHTPDLHLNIF